MIDKFNEELTKAGLDITEFADDFIYDLYELIETGHCEITVNSKKWTLNLSIKESENVRNEAKHD